MPVETTVVIPYGPQDRSFNRIYGEVLEETDEIVRVRDGEDIYTLKRAQMYNSHIVKGWLYTEYADREYRQNCSTPNLGKVGTRKKENYDKRRESTMKGWETRRARERAANKAAD